VRPLVGFGRVAVLIIIGVLLGVTALVLIVMFVLAFVVAGELTGREHPHLKETGVPAPARVATAGFVMAAAGAVMVAAGPGLDGTAARVVVALGLPLIAVGVLRRLWRLPGAGRTELALGAARDRLGRRKTLAAAGVAGVLLAVGAVVGIGAAGVPLIAGTVAAVVYGWRHGGARLKTVERARQTVALAARIPDPLQVTVEVTRWLAGSDDLIAEAEAVLPRTWMAGDEQDVLQALADRGGWEARIDPESRHVWIEHLEPVLPLPDRVELDPSAAPDGLALTLGAAYTETGEVGWAVWDPDNADPHLLVCGPTRSGKSVMLRGLLAQAINGGWSTLIADPKGVDYRWADGLPGVTRASGDHAYAAIDAAVSEMKDRQAWMEEHAERTATNLGEVADNPYRPCLVLIDETAELVELGGDGDQKEKKARREQTRESLGSLARRSRFVQMVMCVATQRPDASIIAGEVRGNLGTRVLTGQGEQQHLLMAFGSADVPPLPPGFPNGRARYMIGGAGPYEMQVPWIDPQTIIDTHRQAVDVAPDAPPAAWQEMAAADDDGGHVRVALDLDDDDDDDRAER